MVLNEVPIGDQKHILVEKMKLEGGDNGNGKLEDCRIDASDLIKQRSREIEEKLLAFDLEIRKKGKDLEEVKSKIRVFDGIKVGIEEEIKVLRRKRMELDGKEAKGGHEWTVGAECEEGLSKVEELLIENKILECEKDASIKEVEVWKRKCEALELRVRELEGRLGCEGKDGMFIGMRGDCKDGKDVGAAAKEVVEWKRKCEELASRVRESEGRLDCEGKDSILCGIKKASKDEGDVCAARKGSGTFSPGAVDAGVRMEGTCFTRKHAKRQLAFGAERRGEKKIAPATPAQVRLSSAVIDIDSDDEPDVLDYHEPNLQTGVTVISKADVGETDDIMDEKNEISGNGNDLMTPKRKRDLKIVASDDEHEDSETMFKRRNVRIANSDSEVEANDDVVPRNGFLNRVKSKDHSEDEEDDDDNVPISQLKLKLDRASNQPADTTVRTSSLRRSARLTKCQSRPRRRLVKHGQGKRSENSPDMHSSVDELTKKSVEDEVSEEDDSGSGSSLGSFIVSDSDVENVEDNLSEDGNDQSDVSEETSDDDNLDFGEILSRIGSRKGPSLKWNLEGEMLSDFGKDPELCMKAVCALYRQQTTSEKACKESIVQNGRGFSKFDAPRGTRLGDFLTGEDPNGNLVRTVEELRKFDSEGPNTCSRLARHYSKQLFEIYQNNEDPFFP